MNKQSNNPDMTTPSRKELFEHQTSEQYKQLGKFVVEFEQVCEWLRINIILILQRNGLKNQRLIQILINNQGMTASLLIDAFDAIMTEIGDRNDPEKKTILDHISKEFRELLSERNKIVHGLWFIGYAAIDNPDFSKMAGLKGNPSKTKGMNYQHLPETAQEIEELAKRIENIRLTLVKYHANRTIDWFQSSKFNNPQS